MEVTDIEAPAASSLFATKPSLPNSHDTGNMDIDMDIDLDLEVDADVMNIESEPFPIQDTSQQPDGTVGLQPVADGGQQTAIEKVHIRGLDNLTTDDVKRFAMEHFGDDLIRLEWIDDTSANIVFDSAETALKALLAFTDPSEPIHEETDPLQLRKARRLSSHPTTDLSVRIAVVTDVKKPRAREASRFYLLNPDKDPREHRKQREGPRGRRDNGDRRNNRRPREEDKPVPFDESMYDDDSESLAARINRPLERTGSQPHAASDSEGIDRRDRARDKLNGDLFSSRMGKSGSSGRLRDRSASPGRDGDGRLGFAEDESNDRRARRRSYTPPANRDRNSGSNVGKELIGSATSRSSVFQSSSLVDKRELFPQHPSTSKDLAGRELFSRRNSIRNHRRSDAIDAADGTADLFAGRKTNGSSAPKSRSLAERISRDLGGGPEQSSDTMGEDESGQLEGFSIRGSAQQEGFSIRGTAQALGVNNPRVKELFPEKSEGNEGKELFEGRIKGRGGQRRRAEDMFY